VTKPVPQIETNITPEQPVSFGHRIGLPVVKHIAMRRGVIGERMKVYPADADLKALKPYPASFFRR
jgi:hypothetical protein